MSLSEQLGGFGYVIGWQLVRMLPERVAVSLFDAGANLVARRGGGPVQLRRNLSRVLGVAPDDVPDDLIAASVRSYARYWREAFRLPSMDLPALGASLDRSVVGNQHIERALAAGRGVVLALPHSGNWDMAGVWAVHRHGGLTTVAERLKPESLYQRFVAYREGLGFVIHPLTGGEQPPFEALTRALAQNKIVCLLGERDLARHGVAVTFFGERTRMPAGPARLAIEAGAPLLPVHCFFTSTGWGFDVEPPLDVSVGVQAATQALADRFAANIARYPADWHMMQPLWWDDLSQARKDRIGEP